jgi:hypothetical protein
MAQTISIAVKKSGIGIPSLTTDCTPIGLSSDCSWAGAAAAGSTCSRYCSRPTTRNAGSGGHRLAGHGAPDFALDQHMALGPVTFGVERLHGRGAAAHQRRRAQAGFHAPRAHRQPRQKDGDGPKVQR